MRSFATICARTAVLGVAVTTVACSPAPPPPPPPQPIFNVQFGAVTDLNAYRASLPAANPSGAHTRARLGKGCTNCWTNVRIEAFAGARFWGAENLPATPGGVYPIGRIVNTGIHETDMYSLLPTTEADYTILITNDGGVPGWAIVEVPRTAMGILKVKERGKLKGCNHAKKQKSEADFRNCDYDGSTGSPLKLAAQSGIDLIARFMSRAPKAVVTLEDPGWISCTEGCCTMTMN